ncbi:30S ribosomal protein S4 [Nanoarchaeota archaeon]
MGDPKRHRKKYSTPSHPWQADRIEEERQLSTEYGFKNKAEIWKMRSYLKDATSQAKKLVTLTGPQADIERQALLERLKRYGFLPIDADLDKILSISLRDILERRLQTQVYKKNLANSVNQARQFITHKHILVGGKIITSPSYLLTVEEEAKIEFRPKSSLSSPDHPERVAVENKKEVSVEKKEETVENKEEVTKNEPRKK